MVEKERQLRAIVLEGGVSNDRWRVDGTNLLGIGVLRIVALAIFLGELTIAVPLGLVGFLTFVPPAPDDGETPKRTPPMHLKLGTPGHSLFFRFTRPYIFDKFNSRADFTQASGEQEKCQSNRFRSRFLSDFLHKALHK